MLFFSKTLLKNCLFLLKYHILALMALGEIQNFQISCKKKFYNINYRKKILSKIISGQSYKALYNGNLRLQSHTDQKIAHIMCARKMFIRLTTEMSSRVRPISRPLTFDSESIFRFMQKILILILRQKEVCKVIGLA